jgi:hypothetical protein
MLIGEEVPDLQRFELWPEVMMTATFPNNLVSVTLNKESKKRWNTLESSFLLGSRIFELSEKRVLSKKARVKKA